MKYIKSSNLYKYTLDKLKIIQNINKTYWVYEYSKKDNGWIALRKTNKHDFLIYEVVLDG